MDCWLDQEVMTFHNLRLKMLWNFAQPSKLQCYNKFLSNYQIIRNWTDHWIGDWMGDWTSNWTVNWTGDWTGNWAGNWTGDWTGNWTGHWTGSPKESWLSKGTLSIIWILERPKESWAYLWVLSVPRVVDFRKELWAPYGLLSGPESHDVPQSEAQDALELCTTLKTPML